MHLPAHRRLAALAAAAALAAPSPARAWWNDEWTARKRVRVDASAAGAAVTEAIGTMPVLVRLHAGNFRFDAAKEDGSDLRFVAADDKTPLKFHLEKYDALLGEALAWVAVPDLRPGAATDLWIYFKNPKAVPAEDAKGTYDAAAVLVYHFADRGAPPRDVTAAGNNAATAGLPADGALIGRGLKLDGQAAVQVPAGPSLAWTAGGRVTWSAWIRPAGAEATGVVFSRRDGPAGFAVGVQGGKPYVELSGPAGAQRATASAAMAPGSWHHVAVVAGDGVALIVDGVPAGKVAAPLPALDTPSLIGAAPAAPAGGAPGSAPAAGSPGSGPAAAPPVPGFQGELDELQISKVDRPAGFLQVSAISQGADPGKLVVFGQDEENAGWASGYMAIILRSVTLDGWIVIALLGVMAVASWVVVVSKAGYLREVERGNDGFQEWFQDLAADMARVVDTQGPAPDSKEGRALRGSPLYRLYGIGTQEVRKRTGAGRALTAESIEAVRASLDAALVRENQRLTRRIVILTIAISGGPFLGLLGTVVGVMITFASIAATGDVNVNAIAPGIAAALVATVAGLAVAIPALFAYNWLLTRIKDVTATMQVFVDELVTKIAEATADGNAHRGPRPLAAGE
jgi:biopolymer transport protein ExbB